MIQPAEVAALHRGPLPTHVAIIMDGNGRWANYRSLPRTDGHLAAWTAALRCVDAALDLGIPWLSFFAFSTENWIRPVREVAQLFDFSRWREGRKAFHRLGTRGVRFHIVGEPRDMRIPASVSDWLSDLEKSTKQNDRLNLVVALNYGGMNEIVRATRRAIELGTEPESLTEATMSGLMYLPEMPDVDLMIRTSGEQRLSNFLLWRLSYAELLFTDTLFPDFTAGHVQSAIAEYQQRRRRFGGL